MTARSGRSAPELFIPTGQVDRQGKLIVLRTLTMTAAWTSRCWSATVFTWCAWWLGWRHDDPEDQIRPIPVPPAWGWWGSRIAVGPVTWIDIFRIEDGKLQEAWLEIDTADFRRQLQAQTGW